MYQQLLLGLVHNLVASFLCYVGCQCTCYVTVSVGDFDLHFVALLDVWMGLGPASVIDY
jgi:hypothetical protein